jgi:hypothetical protein
MIDCLTQYYRCPEGCVRFSPKGPLGDRRQHIWMIGIMENRCQPWPECTTLYGQLFRSGCEGVCSEFTMPFKSWAQINS